MRACGRRQVRRGGRGASLAGAARGALGPPNARSGSCASEGMGKRAGAAKQEHGEYYPTAITHRNLWSVPARVYPARAASREASKQRPRCALGRGFDRHHRRSSAAPTAAPWCWAGPWPRQAYPLPRSAGARPSRPLLRGVLYRCWVPRCGMQPGDHGPASARSAPALMILSRCTAGGPAAARMARAARYPGGQH